MTLITLNFLRARSSCLTNLTNLTNTGGRCWTPENEAQAHGRSFRELPDRLRCRTGLFIPWASVSAYFPATCSPSVPNLSLPESRFPV